MIKIISLLRRKEGMTHEEFVDYWENVHGPLLRTNPAVRRYVQSHIISVRLTAAAAVTGEIDGVVELWFDDVEAFNRSWESPVNKAIMEDGANFVGGVTSFVTEEKLFIPQS
jgi:uncharacterized protein (TIGR02118 family)